MNLAPVTCSIADATKLCGLSRRTLYRLFKSGELTPRKYGSRTLVNISELCTYIDNLPTGVTHNGS